MKNLILLVIMTALSALAYADSASAPLNFSAQEKYTASVVTSDETARCLNCHASRQIRLVETWEKSRHAQHGVGCYECHKADPQDHAAKNGHFSFSVQLPVSPLTCAACHQQQYASFASSSHAMAYETIRDAPLRKESPVLFEQSCAVCHGNDMQMLRGRPVGNSWPNHGIGRINTDGSRGSCAACHGHHDDSLARARSPETCGRCHRGDTGPAYEAWLGQGMAATGP
jgi:formate-dependent nitrite reductase cytochrome c552 subunit